MPKETEFLARELARNAGYDPDQLVIEIDRRRDKKFIAAGMAPVDIKKIRPVFMQFIAEKEMEVS